MRFVVMTGTTLSGKSSHAHRLSQVFRGVHISSGAIAKSMMDKQTEDSYKLGLLSPHGEQIAAQIRRTIRSIPIHVPIFLDGFPRTQEQARQLERWNAEDGRPKMFMIHLKVSIDIALARAKGRNRDGWDSPEMITKRDQTFHVETWPMFDMLLKKYWNKMNVTVKPNNDFEHLQNALEQMVANHFSGVLDDA